MKSKTPIALMIFAWLAALNHGATAAPSGVMGAPSKPKLSATAAKLSGKFTGTVVVSRGSSFGYMTPHEGHQLNLDLSTLNKASLIWFLKGGKEQFPAYIPLSGRLSGLDVERDKNDEKIGWRTLRAVFEGSIVKDHKVTMDITRKPNGEATLVFLVENRNRFYGYFEISGTVTEA